MTLVNQLEASLKDRNLVSASALLEKIYHGWNNLTHDDQKKVKSYEPVYLTMVDAQYIRTDNKRNNRSGGSSS